MNLVRLRTAEADFMQRYPGGFAHPDLKAVGKKHRVDKMVEFANERLAKSRFRQLQLNQAQLLDDIVKIVSRSSMISLFEKPKFRDYVNGLSRDDRAYLAAGYKKLLHGNQEQGFNAVLDVLVEGRIAKWSLMTIVPLYLRPQEEVFVKPTTTKNVIRQFELEDLVYQPRPSWAFYAAYRDAIKQMKALVDPGLSPNNAAFTGFLMMTRESG
ncbi:MAG: hypothetical protein AAF993_11990 [Pseudomonadota bacterium]